MKKMVVGAVLRPNQLAFAVASAFLSAGVAAQTGPGTLPSGGQVTSGSATLTYTPNKLQIDQGTDKAILQWNSFSIGSGAWVNFSQPSASSVALNRVTGTNPSEIFGRLTSNGQVFLTNPNGVLFAPGASVDVGGLFATTLSIADRDFLAGRYNFYNAGGAGSVVNQGVITATGYAALAGPQVKNDGLIVARAGTVALAAGDRVSLDMVGDGLIKVSVEQAALNASAINSGRIEADGGNVILTARSANALLDTVINNTGIIRANSLVERNGEIVLDGGSAGVVANSGTLQAAGVTAGTTGGTIKIVGDRVGVAGVVDASGDAGGGSVTIGTASSTSTIIAADATIRADATREGSGGFVETSGRYLEVNSAPQIGAGGTWLVDPYNIEIVDGSGLSNNTGAAPFTPTGDNSQIGATLINNQLNAGVNVNIDTGGAGSAGGQAGDLKVNGEISKTVVNSSTLTLSAFNELQINRNIGMANGALTFNAGRIINKAAVSTTGANTLLNSDAFSLAGGTINGGTGAVILRPRTGSNSFGIEAAGATTVTNADIASISTSDFVVFGSGSVFTGNMTIGANATVQGGTKNLAFFRAPVAGSTTVGSSGVSTTGNVIVSAGGGSLTGTGLITGNQVQLRASTGIGSAAARVNVAANVLAVNNTGGTGAFVNASGPVTVNNVNLTVGGNVNNVANTIGGGGAYDLIAGSVTVAAPVNAGTINVNAAGDLQIVGAPGRQASLASTAGQTLTANSLSLLSNGGTAMISNTTGNTVLNADAFSLAGGAVNGGSGGVILRPRTGTNSFGIESAGQTTVSNNDIAAITTSDFVVFGSGLGTTFTGNMTIGQNVHVDGGTKNLAFFRSTVGGGSTTVGPFGVGTTGNVIVSGGGGILNGTGTVAGNQVQLRASTGIGSAASRINASAQTLAISTGGTGAFVNSTGPVTLGDLNLTVGGNPNNISNAVGGSGAYDLTAGGSVNVAGPVNGGTINLSAAGDLRITGAPGVGASLTSTAGQTLTANSVQLLANGGSATISNTTGNTVLNADAFSLAGGAVNGGNGAVILRPRTGTNSFGIESAGQTTVSNADIAAITTSDFVVFGSGLGTTFTGNMAVGANATVQGGTKNLAFFRAAVPGSTTIGSGGISTTGNVIVSAGGGSLNSNGGVVAGNQVQLRASTGIGSAAARVNTAANVLAVNNTGGAGAFVNATGPVTVGNVGLLVGGMSNNVANVVGGGGAYDLVANGSVTVTAPVTAGTINVNSAGDLQIVAAPVTLASLASTTGQTLTANSIQLLSNGGSAAITNTSGNTVLNADAFSLAGGAVNGGSGAVVLRPRTGTNSFGIESSGQTTVTNADIASITTSDFIVFGSGLGTTFTGNMTIGADHEVNGAGKNLAFFRAAVPGSTTIGPFGVSTSGNVIVSAGGGSLNSNGGVVAGNQVQLRASAGIGSSAARINTAANALAINNTGGAGAFVNALGPVTLGNVNLAVGGMGNNVGNSVGGGGAYDLIANGSVNVTGPVVAGTINVNASGDLRVVGAPGTSAVLASTTGQTLTANSVQLLSNGGSAAITNSTGNTILNADAFSLAGGAVNGGSGAVVLRPRTGTHSFGIEAAGDTTLTNADIASISTSDFVVFGSGIGTTFTGNMTIGESAQVAGGGKNLAFFRSSTLPGGSTSVGPFGVATSGNLIVSGGGGVLTGSGLIAGNQVQLRSSLGIGSAASRVNTSANTLAINSGSAFVNATGPVTLDNVNLTVGGMANNFSNSVGGTYDLAGANAVTVKGPVSGAIVNIGAAGDLQLVGAPGRSASLTSTAGQTLTAASVQLLPNGGNATINNSSGNTVLNADAFNLKDGAINGGTGAVVLRPRTGTNSFGIEADGQTTVTNADIASISTSDFVVFGSGLGTTFTGNMTIGANNKVDGGNKNLAFFRSGSVAGGSTTIGSVGVQTTGNLIVSAGGGALNSDGGIVAGNQVQLRASTGIGSAASRVNTSADVLAVSTSGSGAFVNAVGPVTLDTVNLTVGGNINNVSNSASVYDLKATGPVTVTGSVSSGTMNLDVAGALKVHSIGGVAASLQASAGQMINAGSLEVTADGVNASIVNISGNQSIAAAGDITLQNSTTNFANSFAGIVGPVQTISAGGNVKLQANFATGTGHGVRIGGLSGGAPTSTNLTLGAGGNVTLSGGTGTDNGVGLGSSVTNSLSNNITITAGGNVTLASGVDGSARIGYARDRTGGGDISITAASVQMNGGPQPTAIRTTDALTIDTTGSVSQQSNDIIAAGKLSLKVGGAASLIGANTISTITAPLHAGMNGIGGNFTLTNSGPLTLTDLTAGGRVSVTNAGPTTVSGALSSGQAMDITVTGAGLSVVGAPGTPALVQSVGGQTIDATSLELQSATVTNSGGNTVLNADAFSLAGGAVNGGTGAVVLRPHTGTKSFGIEAAGDVTVSNADIASISTSDFVVFGSGLGTTFTGNMAIGANAQVNGGDKNLAFFRSTALLSGATTVGPFGVATTGNLVVSGGGALNGTGVIAGNQVQLRSTTGIGSEMSRVNTSANVLAVNTGGSAFVNATAPVTLNNVNFVVGGNTNNSVSNFASGAYDLTAASALTVSGQVTGGTMNIDAAGPLKLLSTGAAAASLTANVGQTIKAGSLEITADGVNASILNFSGNQSVSVAGGITLQNSTTNVTNSFAGILGPTQTITAGGDIKLQANFATGTSHGVRIGGLGGVPGSDTNLTLTSTNGSVVLNGGAGAANGAAIGSTVASVHPSVITINALKGQVILNSGVDAGARIGYAQNLPAGGDIAINAVGLQLNGAAQPVAIRTQDAVKLNLTGAASESSNSFIQAGALDLKAASASLTGPNKIGAFNANVGSDVTLVNSGALDVTGLSAGGNATLDNTGNVTVSGPWTAGGTTSITVHSDLVLRDHITSHDVALSATSGSIREEAAGAISAAALTTSSVGDTTLGGANAVGTFAASSQTGSVALANNGSLTLGSIAASGGFDLANTGSVSFTAPVATAGTLALASDGDLNITQALQAGELRLTSTAGSITSAAGVGLTANTLRTNAARDTLLVGANAVQALDAQTGGLLRFNDAGSLSVLGVHAANASLTAAGAIAQAGDIVVPILTTWSGGSTLLGGANQVSTFSARSGSDLLFANSSPTLALGPMSVPGALTVNQTGALSLTTSASSLAQSYSATGDIRVGDAAAAASTVLSASGAMMMWSGGNIILRGSDTSAGVSAIVSGGAVNLSSARDLRLLGGAAAGSQALVLGGNTIDLRVGGVLALDGTSDNGAWARVQTATTSGRINLYFPNASSGGYDVDGFQRLKHGEDGFYTGDKPAKAGTTLFLNYGQ
jgi:filamentous hemagglutinin family protein